MTIRALRAMFAAILFTSSPLAAQPQSVTFVIDMRDEIAARRFDPAKDVVGVRSGWYPLSWDETQPAQDADGDGRYEVQVSFPEKPSGGQPVNYKFKIDSPGKAPNDGWEDGKNYRIHLEGAAQIVARRFSAPEPPLQPILTGTLRTHPGFKSRFLEARDVVVYLPPGYDNESGRRYPVLYMHDGQNIFDATNMGMEWQMDEIAERLIAAGQIEPAIIVGVGNTGARTDEYTPTAVKRRDGEGLVGGKADLYGRLLIEELKPFIDRTYRTHTEARFTSLGGASLGGLVSLYLGLKHPDVFGGGLLVVSSAADWDGQMIVKKVEALPAKTSHRIWLDMGTREGELALGAVHRLRDALVAKGWKPGADLRYLEVERGGHDELAWAARVEPMLRFLYGKEQAAARPLSELRARLAGLRGDQPIRLKVDVQMKHKSAAPLGFNDTKARGTAVFSYGPKGVGPLTTKWRGRTSGNVPLLTDSEARELADPVEILDLLLSDAVVVGDEKTTWRDRPARLLVIRPGQITLANGEPLPLLDVDVRIWFDESGLPLALERSLELSLLGSALKTASRQSLTFQQVGGRLLVAEAKEEEIGTALTVLRSGDSKKMKVSVLDK